MMIKRIRFGIGLVKFHYLSWFELMRVNPRHTEFVAVKNRLFFDSLAIFGIIR